MNISEFSKRAGLSTATVSRAFHEPGKVRAKTREHVLALADQLANFKVPRRVEVVDVLPTNASGKVLKRELRARFGS